MRAPDSGLNAILVRIRFKSVNFNRVIHDPQDVEKEFELERQEKEFSELKCEDIQQKWPKRSYFRCI